MRGATIIVGAGHGGVQAAASLREQGYSDRIFLVSDEHDLPYHRPPLSKSLSSGEGPKSLPLRPEKFYGQKEIELLLGTRIASVEIADKMVKTSDGSTIAFDNLIFATGSRARMPAIPGIELPGVMSLRTVADADALGRALADAQRIVIVGAGMIGLEFAAVVAKTGRSTTVLDAAARPMERGVSAEMALFLQGEHDLHGVAFLLKDGIAAIEGDHRARAVLTRNGIRIPADLILIGIGAIPNVELAAEAGLPTGNGILVDETLATAAPGVFAIGDSAAHPNPYAGARVRIESVQNATAQGRLVAGAIMGTPEPFGALPWFWSDQYNLKLQIAGITGGYDRVVYRGDIEARRFSIFCFRQDQLVGVESINSPRDHIAARRLLAHPDPLLTPERISDVSEDLSPLIAGE